MSDTAMFTCIAENEAGTTEQNFDVKILGERTELMLKVLMLLEFNNENVYISEPPRIEDADIETTVEVKQNRTQVLECVTSGVPTPSILWMKDFTPYHDFPAADNVRSMNNGQRLEIRNVQVSDAVTRKLRSKPRASVCCR